MKTLLAALALLSATSLWADPTITPIEIEQTLIPKYPWHLAFRGTTHGQARIALEIDNEGKLVDSFAIAYTRRAFAEEALRVAKDWKYKPMLVDGKPHSAVTHLDFDFETQGVVVNRTISEMVEVYFGQERRIEWQMRPCSPRDIDSIPKPVKVVMPPVGAPADFKGQLGEVTVQFYIDTQGKVRLPHLIDYTDSGLASTALEAVRQWEFAAPTKGGEPVIVRASQKFTFVAK